MNHQRATSRTHNLEVNDADGEGAVTCLCIIACLSKSAAERSWPAMLARLLPLLAKPLPLALSLLPGRTPVEPVGRLDEPVEPITKGTAEVVFNVGTALELLN
jgi:hypothetical protein